MIKKEQSGFRFFRLAPVLGTLYILAIVSLSAIFLHPLMLGISNLTAFLCVCVVSRKKAVRAFLMLCLPILFLSCVFGLFFNHSGATVLFYIGYRPITLEGAVYGLCSGGMVSAMLLWFLLFDDIVGEEGVRTVFARFLPTLALMLSLSIRLIPKLKRSMRDILDAQRVLGQGAFVRGKKGRIKSAGVALSALLTHSLENGMSTASSMRARGFSDTTNKSRCKNPIRLTIKKSDIVFATLFLLLLTATILFYIFLPLDPQFFPIINFSVRGNEGVLIAPLFALFCFLPVLIEFFWRIRWHLLKSKI